MTLLLQMMGLASTLTLFITVTWLTKTRGGAVFAAFYALFVALIFRALINFIGDGS